MLSFCSHRFCSLRFCGVASVVCQIQGQGFGEIGGAKSGGALHRMPLSDDGRFGFFCFILLFYRLFYCITVLPFALKNGCLVVLNGLLILLLLVFSRFLQFMNSFRWFSFETILLSLL